MERYVCHAKSGRRILHGRWTLYQQLKPGVPLQRNGLLHQCEDFSGYRLNAGVHNMYVNREPRFYASVGFSECFWPMSSSTSSGYYNQTITYYFNSPNGKGV